MKTSSRFLLIVILAAGFAVYFLGVRPRLRASADLDARATAVGRPSVNVVVARHSPEANEVLLPASLESLQETPIYARTDGYLASFLVDLGDKVKAGQTLAVIEGPEVDQQLNQARAALEQAKANLELARTSATRWKDLGAQNAVAQQEVDVKVAALAAGEADVHAAEANVSRLTQLKQYQTITAPFDGVISARNVDVGALISAGGAGRALFRIAQTGTLRVYASIPQAYYRSVHPGLPVDVLVNEYPSRVFSGQVVRVAGALDAATRTLLTEVQIPNDKGELLAGMFGQVRFRLQAGEPPLIIPSNAVILRSDGTFVATVDAKNTVHFAKVKLGRDFGLTVEITDGLNEGTQVIANPSDSLTDGLVVEPLLPAPAKQG
jgi:membrane fusion protein (multidrug efflux system)